MNNGEIQDLLKRARLLREALKDIEQFQADEMLDAADWLDDEDEFEDMIASI
jgi:hypothetical protein